MYILEKILNRGKIHITQNFLRYVSPLEEWLAHLYHSAGVPPDPVKQLLPYDGPRGN